MNFLYFCARCKYIVLEHIPSSSCQKYEVCWRKFMAKFMAKLLLKDGYGFERKDGIICDISNLHVFAI